MIAYIILAGIIAMAAFFLLNKKDKSPDRVPTTPRVPLDLMNPKAWTIGPISSSGHNYSLNMPLHPAPHPDGWSFVINTHSEPHYITAPHSLNGKTQILLRYRAEGEPDTKIYGKECGEDSPSAVTMHFTSEPTNFSDDGHRWWATFATQTLNAPFEGEREMLVTIDGAWTSAFTKTKATHPEEFVAAWRNAKHIGFTFANCTGYGHGCRATKPVTFIVTKFEAS